MQRGYVRLIFVLSIYLCCFFFPNPICQIFVLQSSNISQFDTRTKAWSTQWKTSSVILFTNPSARAGYDTRSIFKRSLTGLSSEFSFSKTSCLAKAEEPSLPYITGGRIIGFIYFPRVLCEMKSASSRIWTRVVVSIPYDDNHYTTSTSEFSNKGLRLNHINNYSQIHCVPIWV